MTDTQPRKVKCTHTTGTPTEETGDQHRSLARIPHVHPDRRKRMGGTTENRFVSHIQHYVLCNRRAATGKGDKGLPSVTEPPYSLPLRKLTEAREAGRKYTETEKNLPSQPQRHISTSTEGKEYPKTHPQHPERHSLGPL